MILWQWKVRLCWVLLSDSWAYVIAIMWTSYAVILTLPIIGVIYVTVLRYKQFHCFWVLNFQTKLWSKKSNTKNNKIQNTKNNIKLVLHQLRDTLKLHDTQLPIKVMINWLITFHHRPSVQTKLYLVCYIFHCPTEYNLQNRKINKMCDTCFW